MAPEITFLDEDPDSPDIVFLREYPCRRCGALLTVEGAPLDCWLRCPRCAQPGLPPLTALPKREEGGSRALKIDSLDELPPLTPGPGPDRKRRELGLAMALVLGFVAAVATAGFVWLALGADLIQSALAGLILALALGIFASSSGRRPKPKP